MGTYAVVNMALLLVVILHPGKVGAGAIVATSFFMSIMFPTIFALGVKGLGPHTKMGGSVIVMAVVGGAVFPPLLGWVAKWTGSYADGYVVVVLAYVVVALYGFLGSRTTGEPVVGDAAESRQLKMVREISR